MKVYKVDRVSRTAILSIDFWEVELMRYDIKKNCDVSGTFYELLIHDISEIVKELFGEDYYFGIKTYIDPDKGMFYYEIKPYDERLEEFVLEEMIRNNFNIKFMFPYER